MQGIIKISVSALIGVLLLAAGVGLVYSIINSGWTWMSITGLVLVSAGIALWVISLILLYWRWVLDLIFA